MRPLWIHTLPARPRGLALAREKAWVLTWDESHWLYLLNRRGERQAQRQLGGELVAAACADDGSACVAAGGLGEVCWLAPDLATRWQRGVPARPLAVAVDALGQYVAVADERGGLHLFNRRGDAVCATASPRPLHHLAFALAAPWLLASADYGFVGAFDLTGRCVWRDALVANVGALAVTGAGQLLLGCFSEGLHRYEERGRKLEPLPMSEPCRLVSASFAGDKMLIGGLKSRLLVVDASGKTLTAEDLEKPAIALALGPLGDEAVAVRTDGCVMGFGAAQSSVPIQHPGEVR
jgi:hypothetical protein